ncbi:site-specific tyrosine recombinase/integron integrase [Zunongwangia sp.]|uniref:site-specific tyrosine recombinase/integron integrase n=1 Tax=Zunongwangia sp. TaxID=1965325 RepID=UPI003AA9BC4B
MKNVINLSPLYHRAENIVAIETLNTLENRSFIKKFGGVKWSQTHKTFYFSHSEDRLNQFISYCIAAKYFVNYKQFYKKQTKASETSTNTTSKAIISTKDYYKQLPLHSKQTLKGFIGFLRGKRLSESTIKSYGYFVLRFIHLLKDKDIETWNNRDIDNFMTHVVAAENYSISSHRQCVSAIKYLSVYCNLPDFDATDYNRPKKSKYLPTVLSDQEILNLIQVTRNLKHRTVIALLYSGGLRIGELLSLKVNDIDFSRNIIHVKQAKGRKDRIVSLSERIKPLLHNYIHTYSPKKLLIEGRDSTAYTPSSVRAFLYRSCKLARIYKKVTPHTLRHSYATHMLENGVDIRYIQELLGHSKPETTMIYTHVAQKDLHKIQNPLDTAIERITNSSNKHKKVSISRY